MSRTQGKTSAVDCQVAAASDTNAKGDATRSLSRPWVLAAKAAKGERITAKG